MQIDVGSSVHVTKSHSIFVQTGLFQSSLVVPFSVKDDFKGRCDEQEQEIMDLQEKVKKLTSPRNGVKKLDQIVLDSLWIQRTVTLFYTHHSGDLA